MMGKQVQMSDGVRAYLRELREGQNISQERLAEAIGLTLRAVTDLEGNKTIDWKFSRLVEALEFLKGSIKDVYELEKRKASAPEGKTRAGDRLADLHVQEMSSTEEGRERLRRALTHLKDVDT